jgi:tellurite resistance protein
MLRDLRLQPGQADAAYIAIALVAMADGRISDAGRALLEDAARELDIDAATTDAAAGEGREGIAGLEPAARRWLVGALVDAAGIDGELTPAKESALGPLARMLGVRLPWLARALDPRAL